MRSSSTRRISCRRSRRNFLGFAVSQPAAAVAVARRRRASCCSSGAQHDGAAAFAQTLERQLVDLQDALGGPRERMRVQASGPSAVIESLERLQALAATRSRESLAERGRRISAGLAALRRRGAELAGSPAMRSLDDASDATGERALGARRRAAACRFTTCRSMWPSSSARWSRAHASAWICTSATLAVGDELRSLHAAHRHARRARRVRFGSPFDYESQTLLYLPQRPRSAVVAAAHGAGHRSGAAGAARRAAGARSCCSRVIARCARRPRSCCGGSGATLPFPVLVQGDAPRESLLSNVPRARQRRAARHQQLLGRRRREGRGAVGRRHRQAAVRGARRSGAEGAAGRDRAARRQSVLRRTDAAGGDRAEAGRRPPDARSETTSASSCCAISDCARAATAGSSSTACRRCRARERLEEVAAVSAREARDRRASPHRSRRAGLRHEAARNRYRDRALLRRAARRRAQSSSARSETPRGHADLVLPMVDEVLPRAGCTLRDSTASPTAAGPARSPACESRSASRRDSRTARSCRLSAVSRPGGGRAAGRARRATRDPGLHGCAHERGVLGRLRLRRADGLVQLDAPSASIVRTRSSAGDAHGVRRHRLRGVSAARGRLERRLAVHDAVLPRAREIALLAAAELRAGRGQPRRAGRSRSTCATRSRPSSRRNIPAAACAGASRDCNNPLL